MRQREGGSAPGTPALGAARERALVRGGNWPRGSAFPGGTALLALALLCVAALTAGAGTARAEYRAYELEVTDILDCKLNKREKCRSAHMTTSMSPDLYVQTNGGEDRIGVQLIASWMCYGDTSGYREVCPRPAARNPKFSAGDDVRITLKKHITDGWRGKIEVVYYQDDLKSNVYGVRFTDRQNAYLRYFEKDLERSGAPSTSPASPGSPLPAETQAGLSPAAPAASTPAAAAPSAEPPR
jgi:hypothetical protein